MKRAIGPRPWPIQFFAAILVLHGLWGLMSGLVSLDEAAAGLALFAPWIDWDRDRTIIALSASFTIVLIPVVAIWFFASRIARFLLSALALLALPTALGAVWVLLTGRSDDWSIVVDALVTPFAVGLLYTPEARHWLRTKGARTADAFA